MIVFKPLEIKLLFNQYDFSQLEKLADIANKVSWLIKHSQYGQTSYIIHIDKVVIVKSGFILG